MQRIIWAYSCIFVGGMIFWTPSVALHASRGYNFRGLDMLILTCLLPLIAVIGFTILSRFHGEKESRPFVALSTLLGIWAFGPLFMMITATFSGGGFAKPDGWEFLIGGGLCFPLFTFEGSTYDGTLFAVGLTTILLILFSKGALFDSFFDKQLSRNRPVQ